MNPSDTDPDPDIPKNAGYPDPAQALVVVVDVVALMLYHLD